MLLANNFFVNFHKMRTNDVLSLYLKLIVFHMPIAILIVEALNRIGERGYPVNTCCDLIVKSYYSSIILSQTVNSYRLLNILNNH